MEKWKIHHLKYLVQFTSHSSQEHGTSARVLPAECCKPIMMRWVHERSCPSTWHAVADRVTSKDNERPPFKSFTDLAEGWTSPTARNCRRVGGTLETTWHLDGIMYPADKSSYMSPAGVEVDQTEVPMSGRMKPWIIQESSAVLWWLPARGGMMHYWGGLHQATPFCHRNTSVLRLTAS